MDTREVLLETAERLYGERGINGVSLREIVREAGQRNASAAHYHFGSREGLIEAIFEKRMSAIDARRNVMLDQLEAEGRAGEIRAIAECVTWPIGEMMVGSEDGASYIRFLTQMFLTSDFDVEDFVGGRWNPGMRRCYEHLEAALGEMPAAILRQRFLIVMHAGTFSLADIDTARRRRAAQNQPFDLERAIENLIDTWVGAMTAPISEQTATRLDGKAAA
ncbi:TetR family transcriptional regulator [Minwuia sp.]|uniref:TetR family transcriptional regulator n=1 Tax=Minwuia sp. TaxID=2493630 RepID=UPI003A8D33E8